MSFDPILSNVILGNKLSDYLIFASIIAGGVFAVKLFAFVVLTRIKVQAKRTATTVDDLVVRIFERTLLPLAYVFVVYLSLNYLVLPQKIKRLVDMSWTAALSISFIFFLVSIIEHALEKLWIKKQKDEKREKSLKSIVAALKIIIWGIGLTFLMDNLGFKVSAVVAGLGIGGIAVALAAQAVLGDLFSYFAIFFDRPFEEGDFIVIGDFMGSVEHIGIKTTRLRSLGGEQIIFSNTDLTNSRVRNYKRMDRRRVVFKFGLTYSTETVKLKEVPGLIAGIIRKTGKAELDRAHFASFGDSSLIFEVVYYVNSPDYNTYMDLQQEINLAIKEEVEKRGLEFAFPTQTLYLYGNSR
ncbi:MAG: mechanosensitive ion channel family protein [Candidatus Margulisiibacteriota bacterium]